MVVETAAVAKAAVGVFTSKPIRRAVGWLIGLVLSPLILVVALFACLLSGGAQHNQSAVEICFQGGVPPANAPEEYRAYLEDMQECLIILDSEIAVLESKMLNGNRLDSNRVKATFYGLYFGAEYLPGIDLQAFARCFVAEIADSDTVIPVEDMAIVYAALAATMGITVAAEQKNNAAELYHYIVYGGPVPTYGAEFDQWSDGLPLSSAPFVGADGFCSPLGEGWRRMVTSEFGWRIDPITGLGAGHSGIDLGAPAGTPIQAALEGTVQFVRRANTGYGYHLAIDHGGGFVTLYGHCSAVHVMEGQRVSAGEVIASVGSTGRSTGNHLHFEVRIGGEKKNPRSYLP